MSETAEAEVTTIRLVCDYQLMSDAEGHEWMTGTLQHAKDQGRIKGFEVTGSHAGVWGLQLVTFTVDVGLNDPFKEDHTFAETQEVAVGFVNEIVSDSDVEVRWISPVRDGNEQRTTLLDTYRDLSEAYNLVDDEVTRYQHESTSAETALSNIAAIIADHESGDDV